jgi:uncharacterized membrane protein
MQFILKLPKPLIVGVILLIALSLRVFNLQERGIWVDEKTTMLVSHGLSSSESTDTSYTYRQQELKNANHFENVRKYAVLDNGNAILHFVAGHYWMKIFGDNFTAGRSLSILFSLASLFLIFMFCYKNISYETALIALLLFSFNPLSVAYAQEMRTYSMATFISLSASYLFFELFIKEEKTNHKRGFKIVLYAILAALSLTAHYLSVSIFAAHAIIALLFLKSKKDWLQLILAGSITLCLFSLWLINGGLDGLEIMNLQAADYTQTAASGNQSAFVMAASAKNIFTGWFQVILQEFGNGLQAFYQVRYVMILLIIPLAAIVYFLLKNKENKRIYFFALTVLITQLLFATYMAINSGHTISFQPLYANFSNPFGTLLLAISIIFLAKKYYKLSIVVVFIQLCISSYSLSAIYRDIPKMREENPFPSLAHQIEIESPNSNDTIVCGSRVDAKLLSIHLSSNKEYVFRIDYQYKNHIMWLSSNELINIKLKR